MGSLGALVARTARRVKAFRVQGHDRLLRQRMPKPLSCQGRGAAAIGTALRE
jgi:hypothetical protein